MYWDIADMSNNSQLQSRVAACAAQEQDQDGWAWTGANMLKVCASPGWADAWASAKAAGNPEPGKDPAVITDGQILSAVQAEVGTP